MRIRPFALSLTLLAAFGVVAQSQQKKSDSTSKSDTAKKDTTKPATSGARELFYLAVAPKDKLPPIPRTSPPPPKKNTGSTTGQTTQTDPNANASTAVVNLGIRYNLLLVDDNNQGTAVDSERNFRKGDKVALEVESNRSGYLYVLAKQSSGNWMALLPSPDMSDESNVIDPGKRIRVPMNYYFEITDPPGAERLVLVFSRDPQDFYDLYQTIKKERSSPASPPAPERPARGQSGSVQVADSHMNSTIQKMEQQFGTRDIQIRKVSQPLSSGEPAGSVYVVNTSGKPSSSMVTEIEIKHR